MNIIDSKSDKQLLDSLVAEIAKATNELRCAKDDLAKAQGRIKFLLVVVHELINRKKD
jgi:NADPH-dependent 7-cyano-7-deazaguanine reductase QueF-like protein